MMHKPERAIAVTRTILGGYEVLECVKHALCSDGTRRYARITSLEPDTMETISASVQVRGVTVSGHICAIEKDDNGNWDYAFFATKNGKNGHLLPGVKHSVAKHLQDLFDE